MSDNWDLERREWGESLEAVLQAHGGSRVRELLVELERQAASSGVPFESRVFNTPYRNTIPVSEQAAYPGDPEMEERIENLVRWNAMAMVLRANDDGSGVGGHIATYASAATMLEVGFNHFFRNRSHDYGGDLVNVQAHASPGVYARAFLEGRLSAERVANFRRELQPPGGLPSYPHPRRMPEFWQAPTASMGLSTVCSIYQARFAKYLENRGLKPANGGKVWTFIGDGEADEPEVIGTIGIASRERLDNLILAINCNLQRLDGPVRGNGKVIQELERLFRGAGWRVIKVVWGGEWDALFERDVNGVLQERMEEAVDGDYQMYSVLEGKAVREHWVRGNPELADIMKTLSDESIRTIKRGGHDRMKIHAAFQAATESDGRPTVILLKTIKGYGLGELAEGRNHRSSEEEHERRGAHRVCASVWRLVVGAPGRRRGALPPAGGLARARVSARAAPGSGWVSTGAQQHLPESRTSFAEQLLGPRVGDRAQHLDDDGDGQDPGQAAPGRCPRPICRADRARRGSYLRTRRPLPSGWNLLARRSALHAGRRGHRAAVPRVGRRADPAGGYLRGRRARVVHRRRNRVLQLFGSHDSVLFVLFDLRIPTCR